MRYATRVWIELRFEPGTVRLSVEDDGIGLAKEPGAGTHAGYGLVLMQERAQQIGGTLAVESRRDARALFDQQQPDVLLLDLKMPDMGGQEVVQSLCVAYPDARIIILTTYGGDEDIFRSLKADTV